MNTKKVVARSGGTFEVDISDEACGEFGGFKHGDRIFDNNNGKEGTVMGVAGIDCGKGKKVLWNALDGDEGMVSFSEPFKEGILILLSA